MKRFANLFTYETCLGGGNYKNCKLIQNADIHALDGEFFETIIVDFEKSEIYFFEKIDNHIPRFTLHFKINYY